MLASVFTHPLLLTVAVLLPILAALAIACLGEAHSRAARIVALGATALPLIVLALAAFRLAPEAGLQLGDRFDFWPAFGASVALAVDGLSLPFALLAAALGALGVFAAKPPKEAAIALLAQAIAILLFVAEDLFVFLTAWWALPLLLYVLINGGRRDRQAEYAATKFLVIVLSGAALLSVSLVAVSLAGGNTGSMAALWISKPAFPLAALNHWVLAGILLAAWVAAPLFPFHTWLADAYEAAPPSALPLIVGGIQAGAAYMFVRLAMGLFPGYLEPWLPWMAGLGVLSALYALLASWGQKSRLRALALTAVALAGIALAGFSAVMGPDISAAVRLTLTGVLAAATLIGLLAWFMAQAPAARHRAVAAGLLLGTAVPMFWLILGNRAIAVFASQLSLGFLR
jgi:NADH-quinone oxidoreductase subunit M